MNNYNNINSDSYWERQANKYLEEIKNYKENHCEWCGKEIEYEELEKFEGLCEKCYWQKMDFE